MKGFDDAFYLMGDEDTGVGLNCRICDRGGLPVVYYTSSDDDKTYAKTDVVVVHTIIAMISGGMEHLDKHRRSGSAS